MAEADSARDLASNGIPQGLRAGAFLSEVFVQEAVYHNHRLHCAAAAGHSADIHSVYAALPAAHLATPGKRLGEACE